MKRTKNTLTIGTRDKDNLQKVIAIDDAQNIIADILIGKYGIFAFTSWNCEGVYRMNDTGIIIREKSIRVEIVTDGKLDAIQAIIDDLKAALNQESIMHECTTANIEF